MGNKGSSSAKLQERRHPHPSFQSARYATKDQMTRVLATFSVPTESDYMGWVSSLKKEPALSAQHAFLPIKQTAQGTMCGSSKSIKAEYPDYSYLLSQEISKRKSVNQEIKQTQIWSLLSDLCNVASHYHKNGKKVGDIQPQNILLNQYGRVSAITVDSYPGSLTNYTITLRNEEKTYLSPQQVRDIKIGYSNSNAKLEQAEAFSIGLTCLDAALMEESMSLYGSKKEDFREDLLQDKRNRLRKHPNLKHQIKATLLNLTEINPIERSTPTELHKWLKLHEVEIVNSHPFNCSESIPEKVNRVMGSVGGQKPINSFHQAIQGSNTTYTGFKNEQINSGKMIRKISSEFMVENSNSQYNAQPQAKYNSYLPPNVVPNQHKPIQFSSYQPQAANGALTMQDVYNKPQISAHSDQAYNGATLQRNRSQQEIKKILDGRPPVQIIRRTLQPHQYPPRPSQNQEVVPNYNQVPHNMQPMATNSFNSNKFQPILVNDQSNENTETNKTIKTAVVNRGNTHAPQLVNIEIEEDCPQPVRISNFYNSSNRMTNNVNFSIPETSMEDSTSELAKANNMSNMSINNRTNPRQVPNPEAPLPSSNRFPPRTDSVMSGESQGKYKMSFMNTGKEPTSPKIMPSPEANKTQNSRIPPRTDSVMSGESQGQYKMSFTNHGREQMKAMSINSNSEMKVQHKMIPSTYERPLVMPSMDDEQGERRTKVLQIKKPHPDQ